MSWELFSQPGTPVISIVPDTLDSPYGKIKIHGKDGHNKPKHPPLHASVVQSRGEVLGLLDLDPHHEKELGSFATNVVFPTAVDFVLLDRSRWVYPNSESFRLKTATLQFGWGCPARAFASSKSGKSREGNR